MIDDEQLRRQSKRFEILHELHHLQQPGDIVFVRNGHALFNRAYQGLFKPSVILGKHGGWSAIPSHVLVVVAPGLYLHSVPAGGVGFLLAEDYPLSSPPLLNVMRREFSSDVQKQAAHDALKEAAKWHIEQRYNFKLNLTLWKRKLHSHSYCSQLVAQVYERAGLPITRRPPRWSLPIHLQQACAPSEWSDVTDDYLRFDEMLASLTDEERKFFDIDRYVVQLTAKIALDTLGLQDLMETQFSEYLETERILAFAGALSRFRSRLSTALKRSRPREHPPSPKPLDITTPPKALYKMSVKGRLTSSIFSPVDHWNSADPARHKRRQEDEIGVQMGWCLSALAYCIAAIHFIDHAFANDSTGRSEDLQTRARQIISFPPDLLVALSESLNNIPAPMDGELGQALKLHTVWSQAVGGYINLGKLQKMLENPNDTASVDVGIAMVKHLATLRWCKAALRRLNRSEKKRAKAACEDYLALLFDNSIQLGTSSFELRDSGHEATDI